MKTKKTISRSLLIFVFIISVIAVPGFSVKAATLLVDGNDPGCSDLTGVPYCTIQAAIADAVANDVITVAAGTYYEVGQIIIDKNLTITGVDRNTVIIKPDHDTTAGHYLTTNGWFYVAPGIEFNMSGVTLDGTDMAGVNRTIHTALQSRGNSIVSDCYVKNIKAAQYWGLGIQFLAGATNAVTNCEFSDIERIGIHIRGNIEPTNPIATITGITYTGKGAGDWLDYGIEFGGGGSGEVYGAAITGNTGIALTDGSTSAGILTTDYYGDGTVAGVYDSTITGNTIGIYNGWGEGDVTILTASNNDFSGNASYGIFNTGLVMVTAENNFWGALSGPYDPVGTIEVDGTNCTVTPLNEINADGTGSGVSDNVDYCPWLTRTPTPLTPSGNTTDTTPQYSWTKVDDAALYHFQLYKGATFVYNQYASSGYCDISGCSKIPATILDYDDYQWRVRAQVSGVWEDWSAFEPFTVDPIPVPTPGTPSGDTTDTTPKYTWTMETGVTAYQFQLLQGSTVVYSKYALPSVCGASTCGLTPPDVLAVGDYQWQVRAKMGGFWGVWSTSQYFTVVPIPVPTPMTPSGDITDTTPKYTWTAETGVTAYQFQILQGSTVIYSKYALPSLCGASTCSRTPTEILGVGDYQWQMRAKMGGYWGDWSSNLAFKVIP